MGVFTHIQYDEECEVVVDMELTEKADQLQRYDEVGTADYLDGLP